jgi:4-hydroxy-tetrahydrodipicolinate synthase
MVKRAVAVAVPEVGKSRGPTILTEEVAAKVAEVSRAFFEAVA